MDIRLPQPIVVNAMTVDVEDYFQVSAFENVVPREKWGDCESRVEANTDRLLEIFGEARVHATFFVLGCVADRHPALIRRIGEAGHELASHGYWHRLVYAITPDEFRDDLRRAKAVIESAAGVPVRGYRAPSYSITGRSLWAIDVLLDEGYLYDASIFPIRHDRYGIPSAPRFPYELRRNGASLLELPTATVRMGRTNVPFGGGGYFRFLPYGFTRWGFRHVNAEGVPALFYLHPWEIDPGQPRLSAPWLSRLRHYHNLDRTEDRLRSLLADVRFDTVSAVFFGETALPVGLLGDEAA